MINSSSSKSLTAEYVIPTYGRFDLEIARGVGCRVWDADGRAYLDFGGGIAVCSLGHAHPRVTKAICAQAETLVHTSNLYYTGPQAHLAERLVGAVNLGGKVFFCNSGAEANDGLIKLARRFGDATGGRFEILTFDGSFHGRTLAGISATAQAKVKMGFGPLLPGFRHLPFGDIEAVKSAIRAETVAILIEPVQGEGGIHPARTEFLRELRHVCDDRNLLLLYDEVQCGLGRTGDWCGWRSIAPDGAEPDAVSWAKGIANGFPLGSFWAGIRPTPDGTPLCEILSAGSHGTTYGGNPVTCAAALAVFDEIEEGGLLDHVKRMGAETMRLAAKLPTPPVSEVRGVGLMIGIELAPDAFPESTTTPALHATKLLMAAGLLVIPAGEHTIRLLPPLNVTESELKEAFRVLQEELGTTTQV